jgi:hypothetical protein
MRELFREMAILDVTSNEDVDKFRDNFFATFKVIFEAAQKRRVALSIMTLRGGSLFLDYKHPPEVEFDPGFSLPLGTGAAGVAVKSGQSIYIPSIRHQHGVRIGGNTYGLAETVYFPSGSEPFKCILSVPVQTGSGKAGALNFSADRPDTFGKLDFSVAQMAASILALVFDRFQ